MSNRDGIRYLKTHEWAREDGDLITVGISEFAVEQLNREIVYIELPKVGKTFKRNASFGVIESVKAASDMYAPVSGVIEAINDDVAADPAKLGDDPFGSGWLIKIRPDNAAEFNELLDATAYEAVTAEESH